MNLNRACLPPSLTSNMPSNESSNLQTNKVLNFSEYKVRLPRNVSKVHNIMRFNVPVDISSIEEATMERLVPAGEEKDSKMTSTSGAGSEYGAGRKEEARKRRRGIVDKKINKEDLPWSLVVGRKKKAKRYTGNKEKEITANACYYVFTQCPDGAFEAFPVESFYRFSPAINYQTLSSEEAEEQFAQRHKILNYHSLMIKKKLEKVKDESDKEIESEEKNDKAKQVSLDEENWMSDSSDGDDEDDDQNKDKDAKTQEKKKTQPQNKKKIKKIKGGDDSDTGNESEEDGFMDSKEVDYISDSSGEEENEEEKARDNSKESTKDDLNTYMGTESEEEDDEEDEELTKSGKELKAMLKREEGCDTSEDEEDFDEDEETYSKSAILQAEKRKKSKSGSPSSTSSSSRSSTPTLDTTTTTIAAAAKKLSEHRHGKGKKRPSSKGPGTESNSPASKKSKLTMSSVTATPPLSNSGTNSPASCDGPSHGITEEAICRYLSRKPMTTKDLLQKFKTKRTGLTSEQTVQHIGNILRKISPEQKRIDGKLYLTLKSS